MYWGGVGFVVWSSISFRVNKQEGRCIWEAAHFIYSRSKDITYLKSHQEQTSIPEKRVTYKHALQLLHRTFHNHCPLVKAQTGHRSCFKHYHNAGEREAQKGQKKLSNTMRETAAYLLQKTGKNHTSFRQVFTLLYWHSMQSHWSHKNIVGYRQTHHGTK